jgi:hypothetical protein
VEKDGFVRSLSSLYQDPGLAAAAVADERDFVVAGSQSVLGRRPMRSNSAGRFTPSSAATGEKRRRI